MLRAALLVSMVCVQGFEDSAQAQSSDAGAQRYASPPATSSPPRYAAAPAIAFDAYTEGPPASAPPSTGWNGGAAAEVADASAAMGPLGRARAEIERASQPIREGFDRFDDRVRGAADNLGDRTQQLLDRLHPNRPGVFIPRSDKDALAATAAAASAPPPGALPNSLPNDAAWNGGDAASEAPAWNGGAAAEAAGAAAQGTAAWNGGASAEDPLAPPAANPRIEDSSAGWNNDAAADASAATQPAREPAARAFDDGAAPPLVGRSADPARSESRDPWAGVADARLRSPASPNAGDAGASLAEGDQRAAAAPPPRGAPLDPPTSGGSPVVRVGMLDQPAQRPLEGTDAPAAAVGAAPPRSLESATATPPSATSGSQAPPSSVAAATAQPNPTSDARQKAAIILAWVLLCGSGAGNVYLFWSYLDVRTKYRALVRKTARAVGNRFAAA
jgi:hypothetical protein